jgi:hypothetical protein
LPRDFSFKFFNCHSDRREPRGIRIYLFVFPPPPLGTST